MTTETGRNKITLVMEAFYYLFVLLTLGIILILSLKFIDNIFFQIFVGITIPVGIVLTVYIGIKIISANLNVEKKAQLGLFAIILGFVLILASITKIFLPDLLGSIPFAYWGLGLISLGVIFELTLIDQIIWDMFVNFFRKIWRLIATIYQFFKIYWRPILLYSLDLGTIVSILVISLPWVFEWWKIAIICIGCLYLLIHYSLRLWKVLKFLYKKVVLETVKSIWEALFGIITSISDNFKKSWKFLVKHKKQVFFEFLRFVVTAGGIVLIVLFVKEFLESYFVYVGISFIVIGEIFSRKVVLSAVLNKLLKPPIQFTWDLIKAIGRGLVNIWKFFVAHRFIIIKELIRFAGVVAGVYLIYLSYEDDARFIWYYLVSGIGAIFVSQFLTRMIVLKIFYDWLKTRILLIIELLRLIADTVKTYFVDIYQFIKKNWMSILFELSRAIGAATGILLIVFATKTTILFLFLYIGIAIIIVSQLLSRKKVLIFMSNRLILYPAKKLYAFLKQLYNLFIKIHKFLNKHKKEFLFEFLRLVGVGLGIATVVLAIHYETLGSLSIRNRNILITIGLIWVPLVEIFTRKKVWISIWKYKKEFIRTFGLCLSIVGMVLGFVLSWSAPIISLTVFGVFLLIFAGVIFNPKKYIQLVWSAFKYIPNKIIDFFKKIPVYIRKVIKRIEEIVNYIYRNSLRLFLLIFALFTLSYGISVMIGLDFFHLLREVDFSVRISVGIGLISVTIASFVLFQDQLKKLVETKQKKIMKIRKGGEL